jgi:tetratricopeptide (TPR) repeat protein
MRQKIQHLKLRLRMKAYERGTAAAIIRAWQRSQSFRRGAIATAAAILLAIVALSVFSGRGENESLKRAVEAWDAGDYQAAADEYEAFIEREPYGAWSLEARFQLANIYYLNLGRHDQALAHYREFLNHNPSNPDADTARERMAEILAEFGRAYEAIAEYEKLAGLDQSDRRRLRLRIADLYFDQRNYSQALTEYEKVHQGADYDELSEQAFLREASIHHIAREQYQQALPFYQKIAAQSADVETRRRAIYGMADCYAGLFQFDEAIEALRQVEDDGEQSYVSKRTAELEQKRKDAALARSKVEQPAK